MYERKEKIERQKAEENDRNREIKIKKKEATNGNENKIIKNERKVWATKNSFEIKSVILKNYGFLISPRPDLTHITAFNLDIFVSIQQQCLYSGHNTGWVSHTRRETQISGWWKTPLY